MNFSNETINDTEGGFKSLAHTSDDKSSPGTVFKTARKIKEID